VRLALQQKSKPRFILAREGRLIRVALPERRGSAWWLSGLPNCWSS
jgi:hypothetical protein